MPRLRRVGALLVTIVGLEDHPRERGRVVRRAGRKFRRGCCPDIRFVRDPDRKTTKSRLHFDLRRKDQGAQADRLTDLGAERVDLGKLADATGWRWGDPEGERILGASGATARGGLAGGPQPRLLQVAQLCRAVDLSLPGSGRTTVGVLAPKVGPVISLP